MKHVILLLMLVLATPANRASAQKIALGERVPEFKNPVWFDGRQPRQAPLTYIEFFYSPSQASIASLEQLSELSGKLGTKLRVIVVTKESAEKIADIVRPLLSPYLGVTMDPEGKGYAAFGVSYVPFGVLTDSRNRALWMGNSLQLDERLIEEITQ